MSSILNCFVASIATSIYCYCYCYRDLCQFLSWNFCLLLWWPSLTARAFKTYCLLYCYANGCTTNDCYDWTTDILNQLTVFNTEKTFILNLFTHYVIHRALAYCLYICRCTSTRPELGAWVRLPFCQANHCASLRGTEPIKLCHRCV